MTSTSWARPLSIALITALVLGGSGCPRRSAQPPAAEREAVRVHVEAYRTFALEPARVPPPSIPFEPMTARAGAVVGEALPVLPEEAGWNSWNGGPRLFNNRWTHLYQVRIEGPGAMRWVPTRTSLELNDPDTVLRAASSTEVVLEDLIFWAFQQESHALEGDLVARTRAAGPFRAAYLAERDRDGVLEGLIAFPFQFEDQAGFDLSEKHVVASRLTVAVEVGGEVVDLVWVFD